MCSAGQACLLKKKNKQKAHRKCKPLVGHVCSLIHEQPQSKKKVSSGAPWPAWTLDLASLKKIQAMGRLGMAKNYDTFDKKQVMGEDCDQKTWHCVRSPVGG